MSIISKDLENFYPPGDKIYNIFNSIFGELSKDDIIRFNNAFYTCTAKFINRNLGLIPTYDMIINVVENSDMLETMFYRIPLHKYEVFVDVGMLEEIIGSKDNLYYDLCKIFSSLDCQYQLGSNQIGVQHLDRVNIYMKNLTI